MKTQNKTIENAAQVKFDQEIIEKRTTSYEKSIKFVLLGLGIFSILLFVFLAIVFIFVGVAKFFSVVFSFPAIGKWLLSLPYVSIIDPEGMLSKLLIGLIFFLVYIILTIKLIVKLIKSTKSFSKLCDMANSNIDHKKEFLNILKHVSSSFTSVISFILISFTTTGQFSAISLLTIILFVFYFITLIVAHNLACCYNVKENLFHKKQFAVNLTKRFALLSVTLLLLVYCLKPNLLTFTENIITNYRNTTDYKGTEFVQAFLLPWINWLLSLACITLFVNSLNLKNIYDNHGSYSFYGNAFDFSLTPNETFRISVKKKANGIIFYSVVLFLTDLLFCFFDSKGFSIPKNISYLAVDFILSHSSVILLAIAAKKIAITEEKELVPFTTKKPD